MTELINQLVNVWVQWIFIPSICQPFNQSVMNLWMKLVLIVCFTPLLFIPVNWIEKKIIQNSVCLFFLQNVRLSLSMSALANDMMVCPNSTSISFSCIASYYFSSRRNRKRLMNECLSFCLNRKSYVMGSAKKSCSKGILESCRLPVAKRIFAMEYWDKGPSLCKFSRYLVVIKIMDIRHKT